MTFQDLGTKNDSLKVSILSSCSPCSLEGKYAPTSTFRFAQPTLTQTYHEFKKRPTTGPTIGFWLPFYVLKKNVIVFGLHYFENKRKLKQMVSNIGYD